MKLDTEIKTAHLLTGIGLCILLGLLLAYVLTPRLIAQQTTVIEDDAPVYKLPETQNSASKPAIPDQLDRAPIQE